MVFKDRLTEKTLLLLKLTDINLSSYKCSCKKIKAIFNDKRTRLVSEPQILWQRCEAIFMFHQRKLNSNFF